jgi:hypothetical protein
MRARAVDFFTVSLRVSRAFRLSGADARRGVGRSVQSDRSGEPNHTEYDVWIRIVSVESRVVVLHGDDGG